MHGVEVRVTGADFVSRMSGMRIWLDSRRCEPVIFRSEQVDQAVLIQVEFVLEAEAVAFAAEFDGKLGKASHSYLPTRASWAKLNVPLSSGTVAASAEPEDFPETEAKGQHVRAPGGNEA